MKTNKKTNSPAEALVKECYQKTKLGWLPVEWEVVKLERLAYFISGGTPSKNNPDFWDGEIPWYSAKDLKSFWLQSSIDKVSKLGSENGTRIVEKSTILILVRGMMLNRDLPLGITTLQSTFNQDIKALVPKQNCDTVYLAYSILNRKSKILGLVNRSSHGTGKLETSTLKSLLFPLPPLPEQQKIAAILSTWDRAIALTRQLIQEKEAQKKGLMQRLLTGKVRLKGFEGAWEYISLSKVLDYEQPSKYIVKSTNYSDEYDVPVLTAGKSFLLGYTNETDGVFKESLPVIIFDDFTTANKYVDFPFKVKSSAIKILKLRSNRFDIKFIYEKMQLIEFSPESHKRYWISEFSDLEIKVPKTAEQTAIAAILTQADEEIRLLREKEQALQAQKKGLMQRLLTGKIRVKT